MYRLALGLEYDGTDWNGWQTQPDGRTVQDQLEQALARFTQSPHETVCAGRTDAGVHASYQVVHVDTEVDRPDWNWVRGLNALLAPSIAVRWAMRVPDDFHARYWARSRQYTYRIFHSPARSPLHDRFATWFYRPLDLGQMQKAGEIFLGEHDFSAFRSAECQANSPIRTVSELEIVSEGELIEIRIRANAFLHHMVRNLVGAIVEVGRGAQDVQWLTGVLASRDRTQSARTFPAQGLCLTHVHYDLTLPCGPESKFVE